MIVQLTRVSTVAFALMAVMDTSVIAQKGILGGTVKKVSKLPNISFDIAS